MKTFKLFTLWLNEGFRGIKEKEKEKIDKFNVFFLYKLFPKLLIKLQSDELFKTVTFDPTTEQFKTETNY